MITSRVRRTFVMGVAAALGASALTACGSDDTSAIATAPVETGNVSETVEAPAVVTARSVVTISSPASGSVESVSVSDGDTVRKGDVVMVIDSPQATENLADAKAARTEAKQAATVDLGSTDPSANVAAADEAAEQAFTAAEDAVAAIPDADARAQAQAALDRQRAAYATSRAQALALVDQANRTTAALESAVEQVVGASTAQLDLAVEAAQRTVDALTVTAASSGVVTLGATASAGGSADLSAVTGSLPSELQGLAGSLLGGGSGGASSTGTIENGTPVSSGQELASITDISTVGLSAQVDETDVLLVEPGVEADIQLDAVPDATYRATVSSVGLTPTTSSRGGVSYVVRLQLGKGEDADGAEAPQPRPGMSAVALLEVRAAKNVVVVPASAIFRDGGRDQVWVNTDGKAERRTVRLGVEGADSVQVNSGLAKGEIVVVRGADQVTEGQELP